MIGNFENASRISADASKARRILCMSPLGFPICIRELEVIYILGETEFKAQLAWMEEVRLSRSHLRSSG